MFFIHFKILTLAVHTAYKIMIYVSYTFKCFVIMQNHLKKLEIT